VPADDTGVAIIVGQDSARALWLPDLTWAKLDTQVNALRAAHKHWTEATPADAAPARDSYERAFVHVCRWLGTAVMGPLLGGLTGVDRLTLVACGPLGGMPLHAALLPGPDGEPAVDRYTLDLALITYAPSARSLSHAAALRDRVTADSLLSIVDPDTPQHRRLPAAHAEASAVGRHFPPDRSTSLTGTQATREAVLQAISRATVLHAACHAISSPADPMESAIILSGGTRLTVRDLTEQQVIADGGGMRLAVLSSCESAVTGQAVPDEVVGLPAALIEAGAAAVIASLGAVPDISTALLMARFYEYWLADGIPAPEALRHAQRWLRDATNDEVMRLHPELVSTSGIPDDGFRRRAWARVRAHRHPTQWAAFVHVGA
jgi:CHAT domain-containing protein